MLLTPSVTREGKSSSVEEVYAQGWVREEGRTSGDMTTLWPKDRGQNMIHHLLLRGEKEEMELGCAADHEWVPGVFF